MLVVDSAFHLGDAGGGLPSARVDSIHGLYDLIDSAGLLSRIERDLLSAFVRAADHVDCGRHEYH